MRRIEAIALVTTLVLTLSVKWQTKAEAQNQRDYGRRQVTSGEHESDELNGSEDFTQLADSRLSFSIATGGSSSSSSMQNSPTIGYQCERIEFAFCASMPYNYTRMANFFGDTNQIEAADRAKQYEHLLSSRCSRHLLAYLCELLAPMCLDGDAMRKFEIFPCRSFCRQINRECEQEIAGLFQLQYTPNNHYNQQLPSAFQCEKLPYESNGGAGSGPCHETPEVAAGMQASMPAKRPPTVYRPYQNNEMNEPPFVDTSLIDSRLIRPITAPPPSPPPPTQAQPGIKGEQSAQIWTQLQQIGQQLAAALLKHSNLLTIVALVCLVLVLNAKRLQRLKLCVSRASCANNSSASSRKSSSSNSSSGSQRKLASSVHRKLTQISPSASSRSLVMVASSGGGGSGAHSTSLEPSQKLLLNQANQRTLINVNGTLERQQQDARYHLMQSLGTCAGSAQQSAILTSTKHHYDYIQVPVGGRQSSSKSSGRGSGSCAQLEHNQQQHNQQQQVYDNILLSSPSHQILLFGDPGQPRPRAAQDTPPPPPASMPPSSYATTAYANSLMGAERAGRSFQRRPSVSNGGGASSLRAHRHAQLGQAPPPPPPPAQYASSTASSTASSSGGGGGSSASSFSSPGNNQLTTGLLLTPRSSRLS